MDPITFQLKSAIETIEETKTRLDKIKYSEDIQPINTIKFGLQQWLMRYQEKEQTDSAVKLIEGNFLDKLNSFPGLTKSEKNVIILIKQGYQTKEISDQLNLAQNTIEIYRSRIRKKLNLTKQDHLHEYINNL
jgi:DNA-binding CsgD family transcriptional regulator